MIEFDFGPHRLRCDPEATRRAYQAVTVASPEHCGCRHCLNFIAARPLFYAEPMLDWLARLGIPPAKETYVYTYGRMESGRHRLEGWFHLVGEVLTAFDAGPFAVNQHVSFWCNRMAVNPEPPFRQLPLVQLEFIAELPWLIDAPDDFGGI